MGNGRKTGGTNIIIITHNLTYHYAQIEEDMYDNAWTTYFCEEKKGSQTLRYAYLLFIVMIYF